MHSKTGILYNSNLMNEKKKVRKIYSPLLKTVLDNFTPLGPFSAMIGAVLNSYLR